MKIIQHANGDIAIIDRDPLNLGAEALARDLGELNRADGDTLRKCCGRQSFDKWKESRLARLEVAKDYLRMVKGGPSESFRMQLESQRKASDEN